MFIILIGLSLFMYCYGTSDSISYQQKSSYLILYFKVTLSPLLDSVDSECITVPTAKVTGTTSYIANYKGTNSVSSSSDLVIFFPSTNQYIGTAESNLASLGLTSQIGDWSNVGTNQPGSISPGFTEICFANNCQNCNSASNFFWGSITLYGITVHGASSGSITFTYHPTIQPTFIPTKYPTFSPTKLPTLNPSVAPIISYPALGWRLITTSSSGQYVYVGDDSPGSGLIYKSSDFGVTWTEAYTYGNGWYSITTDPTGQYVYAGSYDSDGYIYKSSDYGNTWTKLSANAAAWIQLAITSDATTIYGVNDNSGYLYKSSDSGLTWSVPNDILALGGQNWYGVGVSQSGQYVYTGHAFGGGPIYKSSDYGNTWAAANSGSKDWRSLTTNGSGKYIYGGAYGDFLYKSSDFGVTWTVAYYVGADWRAVATTSTGQNVVATSASGGFIAKSTSYGVSWVQVALSSNGWYGVAISSSNAKYVYATVPGGYLYKSSDFGQTFSISF